MDAGYSSHNAVYQSIIDKFYKSSSYLPLHFLRWSVGLFPEQAATKYILSHSALNKMWEEIEVESSSGLIRIRRRWFIIVIIITVLTT